MKLKKPSWIRVISGKGFIFVDNDNIYESCLNNSKLHLNKKGTQQIAKNILSSLDIWYATTRSIRPDVKNRLLSASTSISEERKELSIENPLNLIFPHLNINSIGNKLNDLQQVICDSVDILTTAETKIDSQFRLIIIHFTVHTLATKVEVFLFTLS